MIDRLSLARLITGPQGLSITSDGGPAPTISEYSRFKYGDGSISTAYGAALADMFIPRALEQGADQLAVTSSGFASVPPAAHSLLAPFIARAHQIAGSRLTLKSFKVFRSKPTNGDYASMTLEQRIEAVDRHVLSMDPCMDFSHGLVVALDDVRVTGVHEASIDAALRAVGATQITHLYLVDAYEQRKDPLVESVLNKAWAQGMSELITLCRHQAFVPNARFCKRIISAPTREQARFVAQAPEWVARWVLDAARRDRLDACSAYQEGVSRLEILLGARPMVLIPSDPSVDNSLQHSMIHKCALPNASPFDPLQISPFREQKPTKQSFLLAHRS